MSTPFRRTHQIVFRPAGGAPDDVRVWNVYLCAGEGGPGPAYTRPEWEARTVAAWSRGFDGNWSYQGQPTPEGRPGVVEVIAL